MPNEEKVPLQYRAIRIPGTLEAPSLKYWMAVALHLVSSFAAGSAFTFPSLKLDEDTRLPEMVTTLKASKGTYTWLMGTFFLAAAVGGLAGIIAANSVGRKRVPIGCAVLHLAGWGVHAFAEKSIPAAFAARALLGATLGALTTIGKTYLHEIAVAEHLRYTEVTHQISVSLGMGLAYGASCGLSTTTIARIMFALAGVHLLLLFLIPDSPRWLVSQSRDDEAKEAIRALRNNDGDSPDQLTQVLRRLPRPDSDIAGWNAAFASLYRSKERRRAKEAGGLEDVKEEPWFVACAGLAMLEQLGGATLFTAHGAYLIADTYSVSTITRLATGIPAAALLGSLLAPSRTDIHRGMKYTVAHVLKACGAMLMATYVWTDVRPFALVGLYVHSIGSGGSSAPYGTAGWKRDVTKDPTQVDGANMAEFVNWLSAFGVTIAMGHIHEWAIVYMVSMGASLTLAAFGSKLIDAGHPVETA